MFSVEYEFCLSAGKCQCPITVIYLLPVVLFRFATTFFLSPRIDFKNVHCIQAQVAATNIYRVGKNHSKVGADNHSYFRSCLNFQLESRVNTNVMLSLSVDLFFPHRPLKCEEGQQQKCLPQIVGSSRSLTRHKY